MKIVHVNPTAFLGSTGRICGDLAWMSLSSGDEAVIAYGRGAKPGKVPLVKIGSDAEVLLHVTATKLLDKHGLVDFGGTSKFIKWLEEFKPDLLHLHNLHGYYLDYEKLFSYIKATGIAIVWTIHDCWPFTGHCCYYERINCEKWKTECNNCPLLNLYPASWGYDGSNRNFHKKKSAFLGVDNLHLVPVSHWMASQINSSFLSEYPKTVIYNGVNLEVFKPAEGNDTESKNIYKGKQIVLGVANEWSDGKGLWLFERLSNEAIPNIQIVLIGVNTKQKSRFSQKVICIEKTTSQAELAEWYSKADVFVTPSKAESFGMVVAEALACGTPCVVNNKSAMSELVTMDVGIKCEDTYEAYLAAIREVLKNGKPTYTKLCRERAISLFDQKNHLTSYSDLYKRILQS